MELEKFKGQFSAEERKEALERALALNNKVLVELMLAVDTDTCGLEDELIRYSITIQDVDKLKNTLKSCTPTYELKVKLQSYMKLAVELENKEIIDVLYQAGGSREIAMKEALSQRKTRLAKLLVVDGVIPEITAGNIEMYPSFVDWVVKNEYPADFSQSAAREYSLRICEYEKTDMVSHVSKCYPVILQKLIETAIKFGYTQVVKKLVEEDAIKQEVSADLWGHAISNNHYYVIKCLVDAGKREVNDDDVLYAVINGYTRLVKFFLANRQGEPYNSIYRIAIKRAVEEGYTEIVKTLLEAGFKCDFDTTIYTAATQQGNRKLVSILLEYSTGLMDKVNFKEAIRMARTYNFYKTATYMEKYLEENPNMFASE